MCDDKIIRHGSIWYWNGKKSPCAYKLFSYKLFSVKSTAQKLIKQYSHLIFKVADTSVNDIKY